MIRKAKFGKNLENSDINTVQIRPQSSSERQIHMHIHIKISYRNSTQSNNTVQVSLGLTPIPSEND